MHIKVTQKARILAGDLDTPISLYLKMAKSGEGLLFESAEVDGRWGRYSVVAANFLICLNCVGGKLKLDIRDKRFEGLRQFEGMLFDQGVQSVMLAIELIPDPEAAHLPPITRALYGYFGYGVAGIFEPKLANILPPQDAESTLVLPGELVLFDHLYNRISHISLTNSFKCPSTSAFELPEKPTIGPVSVCPDQAAYMQMVTDVKEQIKQGEAFQVVVSTRFSAPFTGDSFEFYRNLRSLTPSPYMFFMRFKDLTLLGSSPEALVRCEDGELHLSPIAGTRPRGSTKGEDNLFEEELAEDPKERAEHVMLVDLGRNDLGRIALPGSVKVERFMEVEKFSHVMHLTSYLTAQIKPGLTPLDVVAATFPAGTVSGAPKIRAMEIIAEQEKAFTASDSNKNNNNRGPYAGAIGWLGLDKDKVYLDTGLTIRSLWVREGRVTWQAGAGIVYDSNPANEWKECNNKAAAVFAAVSGNLNKLEK